MGYTCANGMRLDSWVNNIRQKKNSLPLEQLTKLETLDGWVWVLRDAKWNNNFEALVLFKKQFGHTNVPAKTNFNGLKLGGWVSGQKTKKDKLSDDRLHKLNELGFVWDFDTGTHWETGFAHLKAFHEREGHCLVSQKQTADGFKLGQWVSNQRARREKLALSYQNRLDKLDFSWDVSKGKT